MYAAASPWNRERIGSAAIAVSIQGLLLWALVSGLAVQMPRVIDDGLAVFGVTVEPPPPPEVRIEPAKERIKRPEGAAAPPNLRSRATEVVAPKIDPPIPVPPLVVAAPVPATGPDASSGAAETPGPGTGAGGVGDGTGSGRGGDGDGGGWEDETPPRWRSGRLRIADLPETWLEQGIGGTVGVRFVVWTDGRISECSVSRSSGYRELDDLTCRLIKQRYRFYPSRDARGRPVPSTVVQNETWEVIIDPPEPGPPPRRRW